MRRIRATAKRHPQVVDAGLAALLALANTVSVAQAGSSAAGWLWFAVLHLPLVWRRRAPVVVFWTIFGLVAAGAGLFGPVLREQAGTYQLIVALVALYAVARYRPRRYLWPAVAAVGIPPTLDWLLGELQRQDLLTIIAALVATVLLGMTVTTRQAYLAGQRERARQLERERDQQAQLAAAAERTRIARELHDIVAHNLAVMVALADGAAFTAGPSPEQAADAIRKISATGREALAETRRLLGLLRDGESPQPDAELVPQPGLEDIDELVDQVRAAGLRVELTREGRTPERRWGPGAGLAVYRIVQEALTNTLKHAGPDASAQVRLRHTPTGVELEVTDDGANQPAPPLATARPPGGHGLAGMSERAAAYGGRVEAGPRPGTGWQVRAHLRFDQTEGAA
jgi:signal transduction histidine kinase